MYIREHNNNIIYMSLFEMSRRVVGLFVIWATSSNRYFIALLARSLTRLGRPPTNYYRIPMLTTLPPESLTLSVRTFIWFAGQSESLGIEAQC